MMHLQSGVVVIRLSGFVHLLSGSPALRKLSSRKAYVDCWSAV